MQMSKKEECGCQDGSKQMGSCNQELQCPQPATCELPRRKDTCQPSCCVSNGKLQVQEYISLKLTILNDFKTIWFDSKFKLQLYNHHLDNVGVNRDTILDHVIKVPSAPTGLSVRIPDRARRRGLMVAHLLVVW